MSTQSFPFREHLTPFGPKELRNGETSFFRVFFACQQTKGPSRSHRLTERSHPPKIRRIGRVLHNPGKLYTLKRLVTHTPKPIPSPTPKIARSSHRHRQATVHAQLSPCSNSSSAFICHPSIYPFLEESSRGNGLHSVAAFLKITRAC